MAVIISQSCTTQSHPPPITLSLVTTRTHYSTIEQISTTRRDQKTASQALPIFILSKYSSTLLYPSFEGWGEPSVTLTTAYVCSQLHLDQLHSKLIRLMRASILHTVNTVLSQNRISRSDTTLRIAGQLRIRNGGGRFPCASFLGLEAWRLKLVVLWNSVYKYISLFRGI